MWVSSNAGDLETAEYLFVAIAPKFTQAQSSGTWWGSIYRSIRIKQCTYAKQIFLKLELFICKKVYLALITNNGWTAIKPNLNERFYPIRTEEALLFFTFGLLLGQFSISRLIS